MPKAAAMADFSGPSLDCVGHRDMYAARLPGIALSTRSTGARQMAPKPLATAFAIDILIDGLVANRETSQALAPNVSSYLFGRPGGRQTVRALSRSEARRVGTQTVRTGRLRRAPQPSKKK